LEGALFQYAKQMEPNQREGLSGQIENSAGGFSFKVDDWTRLDRFLILGSEGNSYYATARDLTRENAQAVQRCVAADGSRTVARIVEISDAGRAPKNDPALFALALAAKLGDEPTRKAALAALPKVARIGTHLFHFAENIKELGGWGRATKRAFADWYRAMADDRLALQVIKYQQRDGWAHRDLLRKSHPVPTSERQKAVFHWIVNGWDGVGLEPHPDNVLAKIWAFERAKVAPRKELIGLISDYGLPHECVPNEAKDDADVWAAMLPQMGLGALVRNLGKMTAVGLLKPMSKASGLARERLGDVESIKRARLHPLQILMALKTYGQGHGEKGKITWTADKRICDALDAAFYLAFKAVEPTGKRCLLAIDVSGSMDQGEISGMAGISPRVGAAAMALTTANVEEEHAFVGFTAGNSPSIWSGTHGVGSGLVDLPISARSSLIDVCRQMAAVPMGGTDCALPMLWAAQNKIQVDTFCVYTDSETWAGNVHPVRALKDYRQKMGIPAKLVVVGMLANDFTIADPSDAGMLDVCGFDTATPAIISGFAR
jgi:60 kDa SS-A/Ro ribonucleoprotein